jgi:hypothetical protein
MQFPVVIRIPYGGHIGAVGTTRKATRHFLHRRFARGQPSNNSRCLLDDPGSHSIE